jgi:trehalose synthase
VQEIDIAPLDVERFFPLLESDQRAEFERSLGRAGAILNGSNFWHINSTARGGGVAEMLHSVLGYLRGGGICARWAVIEGDAEFFAVTKRMHHFLHGSPGDGGSLGDAETKTYLHTLEHEADALLVLVQPNDVVVLHDPQTLGLAPLLRDRGARVVWCSHVGADEPSDSVRQAWNFLADFAQAAQRVVFSRRQYAWDILDPNAIRVISPCIDAFSPKNQCLDSDAAAAILAHSGVSPGPSDVAPRFRRETGDEAVVRARAVMCEDDPLPQHAPLVTQISRWDRLKDHQGVMRAFSEQVAGTTDAHLVLAGPASDSVADDPESNETFEDLRRDWERLPPKVRHRVHIAALPMDDLEQNAAIVNALQRRSAVIVQKSLAEGFGLTVAEAMWKKRATVASAVGGIRDQISHGINGMLVEDPSDLAEFGRCVTMLIEQPARAHELGRAAHTSVCRNYLAPHYLARFLDLAVEVS